MSVSNSDLFGSPTPDMSPVELAPVNSIQLQWSQGGLCIYSPDTFYWQGGRR